MLNKRDDDNESKKANDQKTNQPSEAKKKANRENAQYSSGPKTLRGKEFSRRNAIRDGFYTDMRVGNETKEELDELWRQTLERRPFGDVEHTLVQVIFSVKLRLLRLWRADAAEVNRELDRRRVEDDFAAMSQTPKYQQNCKDIAKLGEVRKEIQENGKLSTESVAWLQALRYEPVEIIMETVAFARSREREASKGKNATKADGDASDDVPVIIAEGNAELLRAMVMPELDELQKLIEREAAYHSQQTLSSFRIQCNTLLVPQEAVFNRLDKREEALLRKLHRAELALERLQRLRCGDDVPPPDPTLI